MKNKYNKNNKHILKSTKSIDNVEATKINYLFLLRKFSKLETLERIIAHKELTLNEDQLCLFYSAADHRRVEIITGKLYDKIPTECWKLLLK